MRRTLLTALFGTAALTACTSTELIQSANALALAGAILSVPEALNRGIDIPPGHYPPPGTCKIWYLDRPAGQQGPPTSCAVFIPPGAILIRG